MHAAPAADAVQDCPLAGLLVVEHGERLGAAVCGSLLAQLGADVALIERERAVPARIRATRAANALGKRSVVLRAGDALDENLLQELLCAADVVVTSSDLSRTPEYAAAPHQIVCDVTAFGTSGPLAGVPYSDALIQALSGIAETTGDPAGAPTLIGFPFCEVSAGIYAAAATLVAYRVRRTRGFGQSIDVALYDCAVTSLSTFLPFHAVGKTATRAGNRHSLAAPWNAYRAGDGWVLICTATDEQWARLCRLLGRPGLAHEPGFTTNAERVAAKTEVDRVLGAWTAAHTIEQCIARLSEIDIACGPIVTLEQLPGEPNLVHRKMIRRVLEPLSAAEVCLPGSPLATSIPLAEGVARVPAPDADRGYLRALLRERKHKAAPAMADTSPPLAGVRVIEIGQYTTAPLVSRQLAALGAEVYKIEPPGGEGSRSWPPMQGNRGYFFAFSNSDKKSLELDLRDEAERDVFRALLQTADVLVENLKPGSLSRLGFGPHQLRAINPRLVYCGISGFGADSAYPGRPAFDTVVQAMSGLMDVTRAGGVPMKAGISAADIVGGEFGLLAILAALEMRDRDASGRALDISMQDAATWASASVWSAGAAAAASVVKCVDGYVCIDEPAGDRLASLGISRDAPHVSGMTRERLLAAARDSGLAAAPVCTVSEAATSPQTAARELIVERVTMDGRRWPLLNCPMRLAVTRAAVRSAIGELGEANHELLAHHKSDTGKEPS